MVASTDSALPFELVDLGQELREQFLRRLERRVREREDLRRRDRGRAHWRLQPGHVGEAVQRAFRDLGTEKNFGELGKQFFGQLTNKVLQFYASRECANHVGQGQRFANLAAKAAFDDAMGLHCRQAAVIVQKFAGDWQSKQNWQNKDTGGITRKHAEGFAHQAMKKMVAELKEGNK